MCQPYWEGIYTWVSAITHLACCEDMCFKICASCNIHRFFDVSFLWPFILVGAQAVKLLLSAYNVYHIYDVNKKIR